MTPGSFWWILFNWPNGICTGNLIASFICWLIGMVVILWRLRCHLNKHREELKAAHAKLDDAHKKIDELMAHLKGVKLMAVKLFMYDDVTLALIPRTVPAGQPKLVIAAYASGRYQNLGGARQEFPQAIIVSIATNAGVEADALDVEAGDATIAQAAAWVNWQLTRGVWMPVVYCSVSSVDALVAELTSKGIARGKYRIWSAHYGSSLGAHICGPSSCKECTAQCDWTQYTNRADNSSLDESLLSDEPVFTAPVVVPPAPPVPPKPPLPPVVTVEQANAALTVLSQFVKEHAG